MAIALHNKNNLVALVCIVLVALNGWYLTFFSNAISCDDGHPGGSSRHRTNSTSSRAKASISNQEPFSISDDDATYSVPIVTTTMGYSGHQTYELWIQGIPLTENALDGWPTSNITVYQHSWSELRDVVAVIVLVTNCQGVYAHTFLAQEHVTVWFVAAMNDGVHTQDCWTDNNNHTERRSARFLLLDQRVDYSTNGKKVKAGWKAAKEAGFPVVFKMDADAVLHMPLLKRVLDYVVSQPDKRYYIGEMMLHEPFMSGMLYGVSDFSGRVLPAELPVELFPYEDVRFGALVNSQPSDQDTNHNEPYITHRLNLAPLYFGRHKRRLWPECQEWLVLHNPAVTSKRSSSNYLTRAHRMYAATNSHGGLPLLEALNLSKTASFHRDSSPPLYEYDCRKRLPKAKKEEHYYTTLAEFVRVNTRTDHQTDYFIQHKTTFQSTAQ